MINSPKFSPATVFALYGMYVYVCIYMHIGSNILVQQSCDCPTVIECKCLFKCFVAKLADFDFIKTADFDLMKQRDLIKQGRQEISWAKLLPYIPGGTIGMQAPEVLITQ